MKRRLSIVGGSDLYRSVLESVETKEVDTPFGTPSSRLKVGIFGQVEVPFLARHGPDHTIPPHRVNHRANLWSLKEAGAGRVVGVSSVGSLREEMPPGTLVVPDDYVSLWETPTYHDEEVTHITPTLDAELRADLLRAGEREGVPLRDGGVYVQTRGPRLETKAEIRLLRDFGDLVGMTMGSEATLAQELGLGYASLCAVDNYCHGIGDEPLSYEAIRVQHASSFTAVRRVLKALLEGVR